MSGSRRTMRATCYRSGGLRLARFICLAIALFLLFLHFFTFYFVVYGRLRTFTGGLRTGIEVYGPVKVVQTRKASVKRGSGDSSYGQGTTTFLGGDVCGGVPWSPTKSHDLGEVGLG